MSYGPIYLWNLLYQAKTEPVSTTPNPPEVITESKWHQPYSDPVRRKGLAVALIAASGFSGPVAPPPAPPPVVGVQFDAATVQSTTTTSNSANSFSDSSLTIAANSNRALIVELSLLDDPGSFAAATVSWNGVALTRLVAIEDAIGNNTASLIFGMLNPASGNHALTGSWTNNLAFAVAGLSFYNVDTSSLANAFKNANSANGSTSPASVTITSAVGDKVVGVQSSDFCTMTADGPHSVYNFHGLSGFMGVGQWQDGASPTVVSSSTQSVSQAWTAVGLTIKPPPVTDPGVGWVNTVEWLFPVRSKTTKVVTVAMMASGLFSPVIQPPTVVVNNGWYGNLSEPVWPKKNLGAQYRTRSTFIASSLRMSWFEPLSEPVRKRPVATRYEQPPWSLFATAEVITTNWFGNLSDPTRPRLDPAPYQDYAGWVAAYDEVSWFSSLSEPVRRRVVTRSEQQSVDTDPVVSFGWVNGLSDPTRRPLVATRYEQQSWAQADTPIVVTTGWYNNLSEPVWPKKNLGAPYRLRYQSPVVTKRISWFEALSEPQRRKPTATRYEQPPWFIFTTPEVITTNWFSSLSTPTRRKVDVSPYQDYADWVSASLHIGWFSNLSEPRRPAGLRTAYQSSFALSPFPLPPVVVVNNGWFNGLSEPVWPKKNLGAQYRTRSTFIALSLRMSWFAGLSEPTRRIPTATRYEQQSWSLFTQPVVVNNGWFTSLSEPVRRIKPTPTDQQAYPYFPQPNVVITGWYNWLSDPTRPRLDPAPYQDYADWVAVTPEVINTNWFTGLSDPTRRAGLKPALQPYFSFQPFPVTVANFGWLNPLSEPTRRIGLKVPLQPYFSFPPFPVTASFNWFATLSEPTRRVPVATRYEQPSWSLFVEPTVVFLNWYRAFAEPTRRIPQAPNPATTFTAIPPPPSYGWYAPWREPTPPKKRASFFTAYTFAQTPPIIPSFGYFGSLSLPVRIKPKVWEGIYEARPAAVIIINHLMQMAATEGHDFFLGVLYAFNPPLRAYVDIITKDPKHRGNMGIIENAPEDSIIASIVTPQTVPATGTPIVAAVRARVAIIVS